MVFSLHKYYFKSGRRFREKSRVNCLLRAFLSNSRVKPLPFPIVLLHDVVNRVSKAKLHGVVIRTGNARHVSDAIPFHDFCDEITLIRCKISMLYLTIQVDQGA